MVECKEATKEMVIEFRREAQSKSQAAENDNNDNTENVNETMTQVVGT